MKVSAGIPFWAISVSACNAKEADTPTAGTDTVHIFEAVPCIDAPVTGNADKVTRTQLVDAPEVRVRVKNSFSDAMTIGQKIYIQLGVDGLAEIIVWECEQ